MKNRYSSLSKNNKKPSDKYDLLFMSFPLGAQHVKLGVFCIQNEGGIIDISSEDLDNNHNRTSL